jgi:hypothetical protein
MRPPWSKDSPFCGFRLWHPYRHDGLKRKDQYDGSMTDHPIDWDPVNAYVQAVRPPCHWWLCPRVFAWFQVRLVWSLVQRPAAAGPLSRIGEYLFAARGPRRLPRSIHSQQCKGDYGGAGLLPWPKIAPLPNVSTRCFIGDTPAGLAGGPQGGREGPPRLALLVRPASAPQAKPPRPGVLPWAPAPHGGGPGPSGGAPDRLRGSCSGL